MYTIFGASGRAGGAVARSMLAQGAAIRVVLRRPELAGDWRGSGAGVSIADLDDIDAMTAALKDADGAFLLNPPPMSGDAFARAEQVGANYAIAARTANLPKAVVLSSIGAQHAKGAGAISALHGFEASLTGSVPSLAILRAGYFVEGFGEVAEAAIRDGMLPTFLKPDQKIPMISTRDIGRAATDLLIRESWRGKRIVELHVAEGWSADDVAQAFSTVLGRPVSASFVSPEARPGILADAGIPAEAATVLLEMYDAIAARRFESEQGQEKRGNAVSLQDAVREMIV
ncbi:Uncharacterized conserved protein YbjT, contains NAD(P)-binding and DUF2867 domains [Paracoccus halophilus]|uniref:NmrA family protein n=1 Tax=Paracoccus halophilus TaxID=376733 RepID=A0A099EY00_9RHOB|nr:NmrA family NAD(P)-binding protein [Paracoccus halophilus]KGJ02848.1 NmrA family protein [Paracoccus halophilus]SFA60197.1 Uncharacterized conserved protein YbjT, contains NAD(P)-binding and DUF2867 domains [Paracoccus halophilus]